MPHFETVRRHFGVFLCALVLMLTSGAAVAREIRIEIGTSAARLNAMIAAAHDGDELIFAPGIYTFDAPLVVQRDNITLRGAGRHATYLRFDQTSGDYMTLDAGRKGRASKVAANAKRGDAVIAIEGGHGFKPGDAIYLHRPNTKAYIARWTNVPWKQAEHRPFRESIHRIAAVNGTQITLATPLVFDMPSSDALAQRVAMRRNLTLSGFTITTPLGAVAGDDFNNPYPEFTLKTALRARGTMGLRIADVGFRNLPSSALILTSTIEATIEDVHVTGVHNKGGGGNGYGITLHEAFDNRLTGLVVEDVRHAVILSAWHAEARNHVEVVRTNRDINFHGSEDLDNVVRVEEIELKYAADRGPGRRANVWRILSPGGRNHAATDFLAVNDVSLIRATGSWRDETLVGGNGAILAGGYGEDRFVVRGNAVIEDFETADTLVLPATRAQTRVAQSGDDVLVQVPGRTIRLRNVGIADITDNQFEFVQTPTR